MLVLLTYDSINKSFSGRGVEVQWFLPPQGPPSNYLLVPEAPCHQPASPEVLTTGKHGS